MTFGFKRHELQSRYDVGSIKEDGWHAYTGVSTAKIVSRYLGAVHPPSKWLLNGGAGIYEIGALGWSEISVDLFSTPIRMRDNAVCTTVERLPFKERSLGAVVCVGEVLAYCDPAAAIREFARALVPSGLLICDFASSRSPRYWFTKTYARAADLVTDIYNGSPERIWVYDPKYIRELLRSGGFQIENVVANHAWSALGRRLGASPETALRLQKLLGRVQIPTRIADLTTIVALRSASST